MGGLQFGFVEDFRSQECAILALHFIMEKQNEGYSYSGILDYPGFIGLFTPEFLENKSRHQLIVKLKNVVRDLRDSNVSLSSELEVVRTFFRNRKRRKKVAAAPVTILGENTLSENALVQLRASLAQISKALEISS